VQAQAPVARYYRELVEYLSNSHEVVVFPFDWRRSVIDEAKRLGRDLSAKLEDAERAGQPIRLLAHSMGGLVVRAMIGDSPDVWDRLRKHPGSRLLMLGTPNGGSYAIPRLLFGQEKLVRQLALLDLTHRLPELVAIIACFPGVLELLPAGGEPDFFSEKFWSSAARLLEDNKRGWPVPDKNRLEAARKVRKTLDASLLDRERMLYLAGSARSTPSAIELEPRAAAGNRIRFLATARGDGRVLWSTGIPQDMKTWYLEVEHGDLAAYAPAFPAILDLLETGDTSRLSTRPPVAERGMEERSILPAESIEVFPDGDDVEAAALGSRRRVKRAPKTLPVRVSVAHGNLAYARYPVAVGHYTGDTIINAESYLDRVLDGRLRKRHRLGLYPGPLSTAEVILSDDENSKSQGAIIVGLGKVGELTPRGLSRTFAHAALKFALAMAEKRQKEMGPASQAPAAAAISTLLIGTGAAGLTIDDSVTSILRGVYRANEALRESGQQSSVRIEEIEFVELYEDLAIQAARALDRAEEHPQLHSQFECRSLIRKLDGGRRRATFDEPPGWWHRLQISSQEDGSLRFNALTRRARAEVSLLPTQRALLDGFIEQAIRSSSANREVAQTLFEMLLPNALKEQAPDRQNLVLVLDDKSAAYPWELLDDRWSGSKEPLAVESGIVRQLETQEFRARVASAATSLALVIGNPVTQFVPLPGAAEEARRVGALLGVKPLVDEEADADTVVQALHADAYRILHLAGHGVHDYPIRTDSESCALCKQPLPAGRNAISGMVIGDGVFLTPADVEQMRQVPELVFINCCHLGRTEGSDAKRDSERRDRHKLAANIASQFIRMGVRAVVAAGWAVDDSAAKTFAMEFYRAMLDGIPFGQAVKLARAETYNRHRGVNTWGAYQCYGDPGFTLNPQAGRSRPKSQGMRFHASYEALVEIENLTAQVETATPEDAERLLKQLEEIVQQVKRRQGEWRDLSSVFAALGRAYGELDQFREAIEYYQTALGLKRADCPVQSIEQLANLQCRYAVQLWEQNKRKAGKASKQIKEAIQFIETLLPFGKTVERLNLLASAWKRMAWVATGRRRETALSQMQTYYREAGEAAGPRKTDCYPLLNSVVADFLLSRSAAEESKKQNADFRKRIEQAKAAATQELSETPDFWSTVALTECEVVGHLIEGKLGDNVDAVVQGLADAKLRGGTPRRYRSVLEQLQFLAEILGDSSRPAVKKQAALLRTIHEQLRERIA
jgi:CHAT domain-containing protein